LSHLQQSEACLSLLDLLLESGFLLHYLDLVHRVPLTDLQICVSQSRRPCGKTWSKRKRVQSLPSTTSGNAAISLPNLPKLLNSCLTSATWSVLYIKHAPDSGSYVLTFNSARGPVCSCASLDSPCFSASRFRFLFVAGVGCVREYLEVMRVCSAGRV
jgi:hypothetical protein